VLEGDLDVEVADLDAEVLRVIRAAP
jgi:hypothetical protein